MELQNIFQKKVERKKFFVSLGAGFMGYFVLRSFPFNLFGKKSLSKNDKTGKVRVKINPLAVSRNKIGGNNGRS